MDQKSICLIFMIAMAASLQETSAAQPIFTAPSPINLFNEKIYLHLGYPQVAQYSSLVYSPLSLHTTLMMINQGESDRTKEVINSILGIENTSTYDYTLSIINYINNTAIPQGQKQIVSGLFAERLSQLNNKFIETIKRDYRALLTHINLESLDSTQQLLNEWTKVHSFNLIDSGINIIQEREFFDTHNEVGLIGSCFYIRAQWRDEFVAVTRGSFRTLNKNNAVVPCSFMHSVSKYKIYENTDLNAKILEVPFTSDSVTMIFALPLVEDGDLSEMETKLSMHNALAQIVSDLKNIVEQDAAIIIPSLKFENSMDLRTPLLLSFYYDKPQEQKAEGTYLNKIHRIAQKYGIDTFKRGINIGVSTQTIFSERPLNNEKHELPVKPGNKNNDITGNEPVNKFDANVLAFDRPFSYYIFDKDTKTVLFQGRFKNP